MYEKVVVHRDHFVNLPAVVGLQRFPCIQGKEHRRQFQSQRNSPYSCTSGHLQAFKEVASMIQVDWPIRAPFPPLSERTFSH